MNVNFDLKNIFGALKKLSSPIVALTVVAGFILFAPDNFRAKLYLTELSNTTMFWISLLFLFLVFLVIVILVESFLKGIYTKIKIAYKVSRMKKQFQTFDDKQKEIIRTLLQSNNKTITLGVNDGNAAYLIENLFLYMPQQVCFVDPLYETGPAQYHAHPWLISAYNKSPDFFLKKTKN